MSVPFLTKSEDDVSSNSSWSVISESEDPEIISERKIAVESDSDSHNEGIEETKNISFNIDTGTEESEIEDNLGFVCCNEEPVKEIAPAHTKTKKIKSKTKKSKKHRRKVNTESLSLLSIAASVLTITGLTFLCMLFPQNFEKETIQNVQKTYMDMVTIKNATPENMLNKTTEVFDVLNEADFFKKMKNNLEEDELYTTEEVCPVDEILNQSNSDVTKLDSNPIKFKPSSKIGFPIKEKVSFIPQTIPLTHYQTVQNKTTGLIKNIKTLLMDPHLQIFICSVLQDICLIKLFNQLNQQQADKSSNGEIFSQKLSVPTSKKKKVCTAKTKPTNVSKKINKLNPTTKNQVKELNEELSIPRLASKELGQVNNQNIALHWQAIKDKNRECEKRFRELDNKWDAVGQLHRQKIKTVKENYKNEVARIKENEKVHSLRKQKIQLLREKYIEHLKLDRENYLCQLHHLREERQKIMNWICRRKTDYMNLKDACVGNYAVLLPESCNFQQKLQRLTNPDQEIRFSLPSVPTASFPKLGAVKNSKFIKFQSSTNIPKQELLKNDTLLEAVNEKNMELLNLKRGKYMEKVKRYYEQKSKYLQEKALQNKEDKTLNMTQKAAETIGQAMIEDIISHMITKISEPKKTLPMDSNNSSTETLVAVNNSSRNDNISSSVFNILDSNNGENKSSSSILDQRLKLMVTKRPKKRDLYDIAFEGKSKKVKQDDIFEWSIEKKEKKFPPQQMLSKQDPQKSFKERVIVRGPM